MRLFPRLLSGAFAFVAILFCMPFSTQAQNTSFHNAPAASAAVKNPYDRQAPAAAAGKKLFAQNCSQCHGNNLQGMGPAPALDNASTKNAKPGELFWFITTGNLNNGMPSWSQLSKQQRWQIVTFLESKIKNEGDGTP